MTMLIAPTLSVSASARSYSIASGGGAASQIRKDLESDLEVTIGMLLELIHRVRRVAPDSRVSPGQLDYHQRGHRDRGSGERNTRKSGEPPPCGKRRSKYRNLQVNRIPKCRRAEERAEHARLCRVEREPELRGRISAGNDELRHRHRGDDHIVNKERKSQ